MTRRMMNVPTMLGGSAAMAGGSRTMIGGFATTAGGVPKMVGGLATIAVVGLCLLAGCERKESTMSAHGGAAAADGGAVAGGAAVADGGALAADTKPAAGPALIARKTLFGNPEKRAPAISPDGKHLAYLAPKDGVLNVFVGPADRPDEAKPVTNDTKRGIRMFQWAYTNTHILYAQDQGGDENWRVYATNVESGETKDLTPIQGVAARIDAASHKHPDEILVGLNDRDPSMHDVYRVNIATGERKLEIQNEGFAGFVADDDYNIKIAVRMTETGGMEALKRGEGGAWTAFKLVGPEDALTTLPRGFDKSGNTLYMLDSQGRNTAALTAMDLATGKSTVISADDNADVNDVMVHPTERTIQAVSAEYERNEWEFIDKAVKSDFGRLRKVGTGDIAVISRTLDDAQWIVAFLPDNGSPRYYHFDRKTHEAKFLFAARPALESLTLARMHPQVVKSRDGMKLVCYLSLPPAADADGNGKPDRPQPMVLLVHGGPWARDSWGFNPLHQWLANRGYAVMSVNFRGSTGFGKKFINAANLEWAGKMHDDLIDAVDWAVKNKIADPAKVAIMGGSYGGYSTLVGLTFTPEKFACGVDLVGPSSLVTLLESIPPYWMPMLEVFTTRVGDHRTEEGRKLLTERSPLSFVDRIKRPLLIGQGANDPRVKQAEADQIARAMQEKNIPVTYLLYPDEGHGFGRPENSMSFWAVAEAFLGQHLGGRAEPIGGDFRGSTITAKAGEERVPGLVEGLKTGQN